jgi:hypothetical protein
MGSLNARWYNVLTQAQRDTWTLYARNVPKKNRLGETRNVTGLAMFTRSNLPRMQGYLAIVDSAPQQFNLGFSTPPTIATWISPYALRLAFNVNDDWVNESGSALLTFTSPMQSPETNYYQGPYRSCARIYGSDTFPPTSPANIRAAFWINPGQRGFTRHRVTRRDGRLGSSVRLTALITA